MDNKRVTQTNNTYNMDLWEDYTCYLMFFLIGRIRNPIAYIKYTVIENTWSYIKGRFSFICESHKTYLNSSFFKYFIHFLPSNPLHHTKLMSQLLFVSFLSSMSYFQFIALGYHLNLSDMIVMFERQRSQSNDVWWALNFFVASTLRSIYQYKRPMSPGWSINCATMRGIESQIDNLFDKLIECPTMVSVKNSIEVCPIHYLFYGYSFFIAKGG